ncbi:hypothetical protein D9M69_552110 [compost metagenome]
MITDAEAQQPHFAQGIRIVRVADQNIRKGHFGQLSITSFTVDTAYPYQSLKAFRIQLDGAKVLEQRLVQIAGLVGHGRHAHRLVGRIQLAPHLIKHGVVAPVDGLDPAGLLRPHILTSRQHSHHGHQQSGSVHVIASRML